MMDVENRDNKGPRDNPDDKRTRIDVRCTEKEKAMITELAASKGMTVSEFIRVKLFGRRAVYRVKNGRWKEV